MINKNMKENETCEDCFAGTMEIDVHKGELICSECGIVAASQDLFDGDAGKTTYGGDSATHHGVQTNCDSNDQIGPKALSWTYVESLRTNVATGYVDAR